MEFRVEGFGMLGGLWLVMSRVLSRIPIVLSRVTTRSLGFSGLGPHGRGPQNYLRVVGGT